MARKLWSEFYAHVAPLVSGCPYPTIDHHLRLAAQDFCERTLCWRKWMDAITTSASATAYDLNIDPGEEMVQLLRATLGGVDIDVLAQDHIPANWQEGNASKRGVFTPDLLQVVVLPQPDVALALLVEACVKPSDTATGIDETIARQYKTAIAHGAVATMHEMPRRDWTDQNTIYRGKYEAAVSRTASDVFHAFSRAPRRTRAHFM